MSSSAVSVSTSLAASGRPAKRARHERCSAPSPEPEVVAANARARDPPVFTKFPDLPTELRVKVWKMWEETERQPFHPLRVYMLEATGHAKRPGEAKKTRRKCAKLRALPEVAALTLRQRTMLRINQESRTEMLRFFPDKLPVQCGGYIPFNANETVVHLDIPDRRVLGMMLLSMPHPQQPRYMDVIKHLGIDSVPFRSQQEAPVVQGFSEYGFAPEFLLAFRNLQSVNMVAFDRLPEVPADADEHWGFHRPDGFPDVYPHHLVKGHDWAPKLLDSSSAMAVGDAIHVHTLAHGHDAIVGNKRWSNYISGAQQAWLRALKFRRMAVWENYSQDLPLIGTDEYPLDTDVDVAHLQAQLRAEQQ